MVEDLRGESDGSVRQLQVLRVHTIARKVAEDALE
jgi:hypothetical protein